MFILIKKGIISFLAELVKTKLSFFVIIILQPRGQTLCVVITLHVINCFTFELKQNKNNNIRNNANALANRLYCLMTSGFLMTSGVPV